MEHILKYVDEKSIAKIIMEYKYKMEHMEKMNPVFAALKEEMILRKKYYEYEEKSEYLLETFKLLLVHFLAKISLDFL